MLGSVNQEGPSMPTSSSVRLMRPVEGCRMTANVIPTATVLTRTGKKMIERSRWRTRRRDVRSVARRSPMTTFNPLVTIA